MRLLRRRSVGESARPEAEPYLAAGADEARRLGHSYVGTEHVLAVLVRNRSGGATRVLEELETSAAQVEGALACWLAPPSPRSTLRHSRPWESTSTQSANGWRRPSGRAHSKRPALLASASAPG